MPEKSPRKALKGLQLPGMGQPVAQDVSGWQCRGQEQGVGNPLSPGEQAAVVTITMTRGMCRTGAVTTHCPLPRATRTPEQSPRAHPCTTTFTSQFLGLPTVPSLSLGTEMIPENTEQDPRHWEEGMACRPPRDTEWGHQGQRMASAYQSKSFLSSKTTS